MAYLLSTTTLEAWCESRSHVTIVQRLVVKRYDMTVTEADCSRHTQVYTLYYMPQATRLHVLEVTRA
jgi:hypothetical protein